MLEILVGGVMGVVLTITLEEPLRRLKTNTERKVKSVIYKNKLLEKSDFFKIGNHMTKFYICDGNGIDYLNRDNIETFVEDENINMPSDLSDLIENVEEEQNILYSNNSSEYCWNGPLMSLKKHVITRTKQYENMRVRLTFSPSNYYTFIALNRNLDKNLIDGETIRSKYISNQPLDKPIVQLANGFGVAIVLITSDNKVILTKRSNSSGVRPGELDVSVVEAVHMPSDMGAGGSLKGPDLYKTATRGIEEEIGINIDTQNIKLLGYGVDYQYYQWNMIGIAECNFTKDYIIDNRTRGISGKWELENIEFYEFKPREILNLVKNKDMWDTAKVALYWALVNRYGKNEVDGTLRELK